MSSRKRTASALAVMGVLLALAVPPSSVAAHPSAHAGNVAVVHLSVDGRSVDGRHDSFLGLDNPSPTLSWQLVETNRARSHPCYRPGSRRACPGDRQTAFQVQAARTVRELKQGNVIWETGRVWASDQRVTFGGELGSRDTVAWRVRVWDADRRPSAWSQPATWSMGLLHQSDWGDARWIDIRIGPRTSRCPSSPGSSGSHGARTSSAPCSTCPG